MPKGSKRASTSTAGLSTSKAPPKLYSSFLPLPFLLPSPVPIHFAASSKPLTHVTHHIYIRPHRAKYSELSIKDDSADGRTIFAVNLPVDMTERDLRVQFGRWGVIESIALGGSSTGRNTLQDAVRGLPLDSDSEDEDNEAPEATGTDPAIPGAEPRFLGTREPALPRTKRPRRRPRLPPSVPETIALPPTDPRQTPYRASGGWSAHITFLDAFSVTRAMSFSGNAIKVDKYGDDPTNPTGLEYYRRLHTSLRPSLGSVKEHADSAMARHDHLHSLLLSSRAKKQGAGALVDEDGFTVVVRSGRYGRTGGSGVLGVGVTRKPVQAVKEDGGKKKKGVGAGELTDFYRFQKVDRKRQGELPMLSG